ncbi:Met-10+ like-protein-domain-containing protein [Pelagophyceae sp. CCMP2097]|nr:Met-10+ like-protein-domain-containing protein [Pelagophyceae sp. CCMP2097]
MALRRRLICTLIAGAARGAFGLVARGRSLGSHFSARRLAVSRGAANLYPPVMADSEYHALDRAAVFERTDVDALVIPARQTGEALKRLRAYLFNAPRVPNVVADGDSGATKRLLLSRTFFDAAAEDVVPATDRAWVENLLQSGAFSKTTHLVELAYDHFTVEEALRKLIPANVEIPTAFEQAGHVVHLNLRPDALPWKRVIAEVILDKVQRCRTVVNKIDEISSVFRTYPLEVLAGDDDTKVELREADCNFEFDVRDVYWNSRLQEEHKRLIEAIARDASHVVADATCGVGPFAVPLAANLGVLTYANDLNPESMRWLKHNARLNRCGTRLIAGEPLCARVFLRGLRSRGIHFTCALFNLPASGLDLLDAFRGVHFSTQPVVHCYCFAGASRGRAAENAAAVVADVLSRAAAALGAALPPAANGGLPFPSPDVEAAVDVASNSAQTTVRWVRNVAPNKDMYCLSFRLPVDCAALPTHAEAGESESKRPRL